MLEEYDGLCFPKAPVSNWYSWNHSVAWYRLWKLLTLLAAMVLGNVPMVN